MISIDNDALGRELLTQSHALFGAIGLGGKVGPTKQQYNRIRPEGWPHSETISKMYHLTKRAEGWNHLLGMFGLVPPTPADIQQAAWHKERNRPKCPAIPLDESWPSLEGKIVASSTTIIPIDGGLYQRTTRTVYSLR